MKLLAFQTLCSSLIPTLSIILWLPIKSLCMVNVWTAKLSNIFYSTRLSEKFAVKFEFRLIGVPQKSRSMKENNFGEARWILFYVIVSYFAKCQVIWSITCHFSEFLNLQISGFFNDKGLVMTFLSLSFKQNKKNPDLFLTLEKVERFSYFSTQWVKKKNPAKGQRMPERNMLIPMIGTIIKERIFPSLKQFPTHGCHRNYKTKFPDFSLTFHDFLHTFFPDFYRWFKINMRNIFMIMKFKQISGTHSD